jgi:polar amino acid transport system substrate-binding protein
MAGCGTTASTGSDTAENADNSGSEQTAATELTANSGKLVWATNAEFPPYEYRDKDGEVAGLDADIANYIGEQLGLEVSCEDMQFDSIIPAVTSGKADLGIAGMTVSEDRLVSVNFSTPYISAGQVIIVKDDSDITGAADLEGKTIGVQLGTTGDQFVSDSANVANEP